ncbi:hypothetical protein Y1Q_0006477 [Alligator mississippiensis]|nr:hypothetical protein Y1Q_0006477 [Alligator mississippiensis]
MQQLVAMGLVFLHLSQQLDIPCGATYCILCQPSVLDWATDFHMADEDEAIQDAMDSRVLVHHLQTVECWFWAHATSNDWWKRIILDIWDNTWVQTFHMHQATFMDILSGGPTCHTAGIQHVATPQYGDGTQAIINCKGYFLVILQDIIDHQGHFTHIVTGWANSFQDACIFSSSPFP